jgi:hypothetical protein
MLYQTVLHGFSTLTCPSRKLENLEGKHVDVFFLMCMSYALQAWTHLRNLTVWLYFCLGRFDTYLLISFASDTIDRTSTHVHCKSFKCLMKSIFRRFYTLDLPWSCACLMENAVLSLLCHLMIILQQL